VEHVWERQARRSAGDLLFYDRNAPIYLLMVYRKRTQENISPEAKTILREFAAAFKRELRRNKQ
jgi:hypothetical protein